MRPILFAWGSQDIRCSLMARFLSIVFLGGMTFFTIHLDNNNKGL